MSIGEHINEEKSRQQAVEWFARQRGSKYFLDDDQTFQSWLKTDSRNAAAYEQCSMLWEMSSGLKYDKNIQTEIDSVMEDEAGRKFLSYGSSASFVSLAAAFMAVIFMCYYTLFAPYKFQTDVGETRTFVLADGTVATLNTNSELAVWLSRQERFVKLIRGEVHLRVAPETERVFKIKAEERTAQALGTELNILSKPNEVQFAVLKGSIAFDKEKEQSPEIKSVYLNTGSMALFKTSDLLPQIQSFDYDVVTAWRNRRINFKSIPLSSAISEYNRYHREKIILKAANIADEKITGVFNVDDNQSFIFAIKTAFRVDAFRKNDSIIIANKSS